MQNKTRTPLFHVAKRAALPWYKSWAIRGVALLLALLLCGVITGMVTGLNPAAVYGAIWQGSFGTTRKLWVLLQNIAMLLCVSLAVTPAFRMRCWNLGGEGQALIGGLAAAACMILLPGKLPNAVVILCMIAASVLAGALWAGIPAFFKAKYNTNET
ncbi:MAG: ABC transporter permease, partial [Oscillospiraceae bacterium]|nr:ABC transporter permease [Oscillospiraceae bacterium]